MRLATFRYAGQVRLGAVDGTRVISLQDAYRALLSKDHHPCYAARHAAAVIPNDMTEFLQGGDDSLEAAKRAVELACKPDFKVTEAPLAMKLSEVRLLAPLLRPASIICIGRNYMDHVDEMRGGSPQEYPVFFAKFQNSVCGPGDPIPKPILSDDLDYEAELAVVIGRRGKHIAAKSAFEYVAGYTVANDITVRDYQRRTSQWLQGKTFDGSLPLGPMLVTRDELEPGSLDISLSVNEEELQRSNTQHLLFGIPEIISYVSGIKTLEPGDVICTGTPAGVGVAREPPVFLKNGDIVRVEIAGIGVLENPVMDEGKLAAGDVAWVA